MIQGDNVIIDVNENIDGTKGKLIKKTGVFIPLTCAFRYSTFPPLFHFCSTFSDFLQSFPLGAPTIRGKTGAKPCENRKTSRETSLNRKGDYHD